MILHPDIARWMVSLHQERLAELARLSRPRPVAAGRRRRGGIAIGYRCSCGHEGR